MANLDKFLGETSRRETDSALWQSTLSRIEALESKLEEWQNLTASCISELRNAVMSLEQRTAQQSIPVAFDLAMRTIQNTDLETEDPTERRANEKAMQLVERCIDVALQSFRAGEVQPGGSEAVAPGASDGATEETRGSAETGVGDREKPGTAEDD